MRKIVALLLTVAMVLSLIPAQLVSAQTPAGAAFSRSFTPRRAAASPFMMFSDIVAPQVTSPASIDVLDATGQHWVRSTDAADGTYVAAQAVYSVVFDGFNFTSPVAIGLGVEPSRQNINGPRYAYVPATISMNPAFQHLDWEGRLYPSPALDGTGVLMVEFVALNASWMAGPRDVTITAPFYTEDGTSYDITIDFVLDLNPPSAIPSMTVANAQGTMFTGSQNSVSFNITTAGIPSGSHELAWFVTTAAGTQAQNVPGVTLPATLNVAANGSATLTLTGTPTTAGTWYIHPAIPVAGSYGLYAYHFIRLTVQHPPTGGGGGGGGGGGQQQQPPAQQPPAQPPAQPPGNTTNVIINNVNKVVVNTNVTNTVIVNVINEARQKGERPVVEIELDRDQDGIKVGGNDIRELVRYNGVLVVIKANVRMEFNSTQMANWNINVNSEIVISMRPVEERSEKEHVFRNKRPGRKPGNAPNVNVMIDMMLSVLVEINVVIDGNIATGNDARPSISVNIAELNLSIEVLANLKGVFFFYEDPDDPDSITYILLDGLFDGDYFTVNLPDIAGGWFTLMSIEVEVEVSIEFNMPSLLRMQLGSTAMAVDGASQGLDAAPFLADPNDPDSLMLPVRAIAEAMGAEVSWNAALRMVVIVNIQLNINISFSVDEPLPSPDGDNNDNDQGQDNDDQGEDDDDQGEDNDDQGEDNDDQGEDEDDDDDDNKPQIINGRTFVPRRFMSEMMGVNVDYNPATEGIYITPDA